MKKRVFYLSLLVLFIFLSGCESDLLSPNNSENESTLLKNGKSNKVQLCHTTGNDQYVLIEVSQNAVEAHLAHGDILLDADGDGYTAYGACFGSMDDCDDNDPTVYPGAEEICGDGIDNNCNGEIDEDCTKGGDCPPDFSQGFEVDTDSWKDGTNGFFGSIERVNSGANGITSFEGSFHAIVNGNSPTGPSSPFAGESNTWVGPWSTEISVYLDPVWSSGEGFNYSVDVNDTDGYPLRYFVFHIAKDIDTGTLLAGVSNNLAYWVVQDLENLPHIEINQSGWYTFRHEFFDNNGQLAVNMKILDDGGNELFSETKSFVGDYIPNKVGGNGSAWFMYTYLTGGLSIDNQKLFRNCE